MACFTVPLAGAVAAGAAHKAMKKSSANPFVTKLPWLVLMLAGGVLMLAVDHVYSGELVARPPFLTALANEADTSAMLHEMKTVGVSMTVLILAVWVGMVVVSELFARNARRRTNTAQD